MIRRAALRAALGGVFGAALARKAAPAVIADMGSNAIPPGNLVGGVLNPKALDESGRKWRALSLLTAGRDEARARDEAILQLLGGYPPRIAASHSWAPWFKAQAAAREVQRMRLAHSSFCERMRQQVFGPD